MTKFKQQQVNAVAAFEAKIEEINKKGNVNFQDIQALNTAAYDHNVAVFNRNKYGTLTERETIINNARQEAMNSEIERIMKEKYQTA